MLKKILMGVAALALVVAFAPAAQAQETGERSFDLVAGLYVPGIDDLDNDRITARAGRAGRVAE